MHADEPQNFAAKGAEDAKEKKSLTAKHAEGAEEIYLKTSSPRTRRQRQGGNSESPWFTLAPSPFRIA
jgi:hypothetical protein